MLHRLMGRAHAAWLTSTDRLAAPAGQGTVEYVALILLVAVVLAGVVAATKKSHVGTAEIGNAIMQKLKDAIGTVK